jgi:hypothetical protein
MVRLTPDGLSRKTMRDIMAFNGIRYRHQCNDETEDFDGILIGEEIYHHAIMEETYSSSWQISGNEGDLVFFDLVTYGYGESISWCKLQAQKEELEAWAKVQCEKFHCSYEIAISANYW